MFRTLIYPSSGACDYACNTDTTQTQPHRNSNTQRTKNITTNVVIQRHSRKLLMMDILMSETCWTHKNWNKIASNIKLVFYSSNYQSWTISVLLLVIQGSKAVTGPKGYYRCRQIIATNLGKRRLTRHRSALPANLTSSRPRSWSLGNTTLVVAERSGWRRVLGAEDTLPNSESPEEAQDWFTNDN